MSSAKAWNAKCGEHLAKFLVDKREKIGATRRDLAKLSGVHEDILMRTECHGHLPSLTTLVKIADALDVRVSELFG